MVRCGAAQGGAGRAAARTAGVGEDGAVDGQDVSHLRVGGAAAGQQAARTVSMQADRGRQPLAGRLPHVS